MVQIEQDNKYYLYRHVRLDTNVPFYIGIGTKPTSYKTHKGEFSRAFDVKKRSKYWKSVTSKCDFRVEIIFEATTRESIKEKEIEFIKLYGRKDLSTGTLVNLTGGGEGMFDISEGTRKEISNKSKNMWAKNGFKEAFIKSHKETFKCPKILKRISENSKKAWEDPEYVVKIKASRKITSNDPIVKAKISKASKKNWEDPEYRKKKSLSSKEMWECPEFREKMSLKKKGIKISQKAINKIKEGKRELNGTLVVDKETGIFYSSLVEACESINSNYNTARTRLNTKSKLSRFIRATDN